MKAGDWVHGGGTVSLEEQIALAAHSSFRSIRPHHSLAKCRAGLPGTQVARAEPAGGMYVDGKALDLHELRDDLFREKMWNVEQSPIRAAFACAIPWARRSSTSGALLRLRQPALERKGRSMLRRSARTPLQARLETGYECHRWLHPSQPLEQDVYTRSHPEGCTGDGAGSSAVRTSAVEASGS